MENTETAHEKFLRLGQGRVNAALKALAEVADLAAPEFEYSEQELQLMLDALFDALHTTKRVLQTKVDRKRSFNWERK